VIATTALDRLLRVESLAVLGALTLVAVLVALSGRWRNDPRRADAARAITLLVRIGFVILVAAIFGFLVLVIFVGPIGNP
jgi:hypothetical protein